MELFKNVLKLILLLLMVIVLGQVSIQLYKNDIVFNLSNHSVEYKRTGSDGINYYFSISDTIPTFPKNLLNFFRTEETDPAFPKYKRRNAPFPENLPDVPENTPHISLFQGNPRHLHSLVSLENFAVTGDDSLSAIIGVVDISGNTNNVLKITPNKVAINTAQFDDTLGGACYLFSKTGVEFRYGLPNGNSGGYVLSNKTGKAGQVLALNVNADTARWANLIQHVEDLGLKSFTSTAQGVAAGLKKGDAFILTTNIGKCTS